MYRLRFWLILLFNQTVRTLASQVCNSALSIPEREDGERRREGECAEAAVWWLVTSVVWCGLELQLDCM